MSEVVTGPGGGRPDLPPIGDHPFRPAVIEGASTWSLTWHGVRTVAVLELRQRIRSTRWLIVLVIWAAVIGGLTALIRWAVFENAGLDPEGRAGAGATMFGVIVFLVLSLGGLISPALSATSVNGDRAAGVLAIMQSTLLTPAELAVGKLLAAWTSALALLAVTLPFVAWAYFEGGTPIGRLMVTLIVLALTLLMVCAVALGYSALTAKMSTSSVLTYLTIAFLGLGLPLLFALSLTLVSTNDQVSVRQPVQVDQNTSGETTSRCETQSTEIHQAHTERTWWLLAPSPYVVVADAAPTPSGLHRNDPLTAIRTGVREARLGPEKHPDWCDDSITKVSDDARTRQQENLPSTWPYGLGADLLVGSGFLALTVRRLRTPADRLAKGTRIA